MGHDYTDEHHPGEDYVHDDKSKINLGPKAPHSNSELLGTQTTKKVREIPKNELLKRIADSKK